jgi:protein-export membrane protein SecD
MIQVPTWKKVLVALVCFLSVYLAIPSINPEILQSSFGAIFPDKKVNLGLDLRGGAYILLEVDFKSYDRDQSQKYLEEIRMKLRAARVAAEGFTVTGEKITFAIKDSEQAKATEQAVYDAIGNLGGFSLSGNTVTVTYDDQTSKSLRNDMMMQTIEIVRRRIDEAGTKEVDIQRQGDSYILVQVPGAENPDEIKRLLGKTAKLTFHLVDENVSLQDARSGNLPFGTKLLPMVDKTSQEAGFIAVYSRPLLSGDKLVDAQTTINLGAPLVSFKFNNLGAKIFGDITAENVHKRLAIVLDNKVISAPSINEPILSGSGQISGNFTVQSANELALLLRAGALPVPLKIAEERTVGPSLGKDSIESGSKAAIIGTLLVIVFMILFYGTFGLMANFALVINLFMIITVLSLFDATLTLPGIAGMVLTLGMAVDANVLIFERIREEMRKGRTPLAAMESGFNLAFDTILDSNLTTVLVSTVLFLFGSGPVKGFAITLTIGILCSMFSAIVVVKVMMASWYRRTRPKQLPL